MARRLRIGVVGLGAAWRKRYRPALAGLRQQFRVRAVADPSRERAGREARRLGCPAVRSLGELVEGDDIDAVLVCGDPWFRLWPLERAVRVGKPGLCAGLRVLDDPNCDALADLARERQVTLGVALLPRLAPVWGRVRELLEGQLGPARFVVGRCALPARVADVSSAAGVEPAEVALLDIALDLFAAVPERVRVDDLPAVGERSRAVEFADGRAARLSVWRSPAVTRPVFRWQIVAERGQIHVAPPRRLSWAGPEGRFRQRLAGGGSGRRLLLEGFARQVRGGEGPVPGLDEACRVLNWLRNP